MPEPLKHRYNKTLISSLAQAITTRYPGFDGSAFEWSVFAKGWENKELKQRMRHIAQCLHQHLPTDYETAINILKPVSENFSGFEYMFFQDYVECFGLGDFETSISALEHFTKYASSEFAVRAFILQDEKRMMKQMNIWANSDNHHVRRLASEGCRPRLPWAIALPAFKNDPRPILPVLKKLMKDESEYVRRSVANNLNDISKDNPDIVLDWAKQWLSDKSNKQSSKQTNKLIKHACRTLLKQGDQRILALFDYAKAKHIKIDEFKVQHKVKIGEELTFSCYLKTDNKKLGKCRIEFSIDFVKANGKLNPKVFKISEFDYNNKEKRISKKFSFKKITTRRYYVGTHKLSIIINGDNRASKSFELIQ